MYIPKEHQSQVLEDATPGWALVHAVRPPPETTPDGANYPALLHDAQHNLETATLYHRTVYYLPNHASVQHGSRIEINYAPDSERLIFHALQIRRGGEVIDLLPSQEVRVLHREAQMERFVFDGRLLAVLVLNDVRAGDVVDYSYSLQAVKEPLFGRMHGQFLLQGAFSAEAVRCRLLYREDRAVYVAPRRCDLQPTASFTDDGLVDCQWQLDDVRPVRLEPDMPSWALPFKWIDYGEFSTWNEVAEAASRLFATSPEAFPDYLSPWLEDARAKAGSAEQFIQQIVRYVQEQIRYVSVSLDDHTHAPYDIATILQRNYGDCKDKSTLLCQLLQKAGFDAKPALVNAHSRRFATEGLARPTAFNHVITRLKHNGQTHWIDATLTDQGGQLETLSCPSYGVALVLNSSDPEDVLATIPPSPVPPTIAYDESVTIHSAYSSAEMLVSCLFLGAAADDMRHRLTRIGLAEVERAFLTDYQRAYPKIDFKQPTVVQDDRDGNRLKFVYSLLQNGIWRWFDDPRNPNNRINQACFHVFGIYQAMRGVPAGTRHWPYGVAHPLHVSASLDVTLPIPYPPERKARTFRSACFECKYTRDISRHAARMSFQYASKRDFVNPKELADHASELRQMSEFTRFFVQGRGGSAKSGPGARQGSR